MAKPTSYRELVRKFRALGWEGPFPGGRHPYMVKGNHQIHIPNPHRGDIDWSLMKRILMEAEIERDEWDRA